MLDTGGADREENRVDACTLSVSLYLEMQLLLMWIIQAVQVQHTHD